ALVAVLPVAPTLYAADLGQPDLSRGQALEHPQLRGRVRADVVVVVECPDLRPVPQACPVGPDVVGQLRAGGEVELAREDRAAVAVLDHRVEERRRQPRLTAE